MRSNDIPRRGFLAGLIGLVAAPLASKATEVAAEKVYSPETDPLGPRSYVLYNGVMLGHVKTVSQSLRSVYDKRGKFNHTRMTLHVIGITSSYPEPREDLRDRLISLGQELWIVHADASERYKNAIPCEVKIGTIVGSKLKLVNFHVEAIK